MEHIIQFGVTIDEQKIIDTATKNASNEIVGKVRHEIYQYTRGYYETKLDRIFKEEVKKVVDDNKDRIIDQAIKNLSANLTRTKAVKEMIAKMESDNE